MFFALNPNCFLPYGLLLCFDGRMSHRNVDLVKKTWQKGFFRDESSGGTIGLSGDRGNGASFNL
jgi:hypothetical protein